MYPSFAPPTDADIIIIGAGISGMSAAFYLLEREPTLTILILEAKRKPPEFNSYTYTRLLASADRIGGRTLSFPLKIAEGNHMRTFDFGGQFVSTNQVHLMDLLHKLDLRLVKPPDKRGRTICNLQKDKITTMSENAFDFTNLEERIELMKFFQTIRNMSKTVSFTSPYSLPNSERLDSTMMETFIEKNLTSSFARNFIKHVIRTSCGVEPSQITVLFYLAFCNATGCMEHQFLTANGGANETWIQGGADQICHRIASRIGRKYIKTNEPVVELIREPFQVTVETENETYQCSYVIIAVPPKEIIDITFYPPLASSRLELLRNIKEGHLIKFVATYKTAFWREKGYTGHIISNGREAGHGPIQGCYDISLKNWPALTGYIASIDCLEQPKSFKEDVLQQLAKYFGEEALNPIDYFEKCWLDEPYIYNCMMNCPGVGSMNKYPEIRRPIGRLFWAGTETATSWNGYMGGAVQAGYRAAIEVLYECRPQALTREDIEFVHARRKPRTNLTQTIVSYGTNWRMLIPAAAVIFSILYFRQQTR